MLVGLPLWLGPRAADRLRLPGIIGLVVAGMLVGPNVIGTRVVVPVSNPRTVRTLVRIAAQVAAPDAGAVIAVNVLPFDARPEQMKIHRELAAAAAKVALAACSEVNTAVWIDSSTVGGVLHTIVEQSGTSLVMGWKGYANAREGFFGSVIDQIVSRSPVPVPVLVPH